MDRPSQDSLKGLSYSRGPEVPLLEQTIPEVLFERARELPKHEAVVVRHQNVRLSYSDLQNCVETVAGGLIGLGLQPGDRIGVWAAACIEWILLFLACARTGIIQVNVNPAYRSSDLGFVLKKSKMKALFLHERDARADYRAILEEALNSLQSPLEHIVYLGQESWDRMIANAHDTPTVKVRPNDVFNIQYTSGTTGSPKGVLLTHHNVLNNAWTMAQWLNWNESDRVCDGFPFYHTAGCVLGILACVASGATLIIPSPQFDAEKSLEAVHVEGVTCLMGSPTMFIAQLNHPELARFDMTSLRSGVMGGSPCPIEIMNRVAERMHCPGLVVIYGQTESSPIITMSSVSDTAKHRLTTIGCAVPNVEVKIVSPLNNETAPIGEQGELCTRGYLVMKGYDQEPEATAKAIDSEGWLHTGDLATMRSDGYFHITGRAKDMIIRGGENIYPREIEEFLYSHPKIMDVQIVGLPDEKLGEVVLAWIRLKSGESCNEQEIRDFCRDKIAYFKIPEYIRFVGAFPMTVSGKVQKFKIREIEIAERHLEKAARVETA